MQDKDILKALRLMGDYTARQVDIILAPIERIKYPTKTELQRLVDKTISILLSHVFYAFFVFFKIEEV